MRQCLHCDSFVPTASSQCPGCQRNTSSWWRMPLTVLGASMVGMALSACYGPPCAGAACQDRCRDTLADGGAAVNDPTYQRVYACAADSGATSSDAGAVDGGIRDAGP
jgi:hypothetical protein